MEKVIYDDDVRDATRSINRALRGVNRQLRRARERAKQETDEIVAALFDAPADAKVALRRIWEETGMQDFCGPDDYERIANAVIIGLSGRRLRPVDAPTQDPEGGLPNGTHLG